MSRMRATGRQAGFTLLEMLVALSVLAIAALALMRLNGFAVATAADLDARLLADVVVQNEAVLASTDPGPLVRGTTSASVSNGGRRFAVRRTVTPTADARLVRIDLLALEAGSGARAALTIIRRVD